MPLQYVDFPAPGGPITSWAKGILSVSRRCEQLCLMKTNDVKPVSFFPYRHSAGNQRAVKTAEKETAKGPEELGR